MITSAEQLKNTKIKVSTPEISEKVQKKLFEFGYKRIDGIDTVFYTELEYIFIYNHVFSNVDGDKLLAVISRIFFCP